jgi:hypothetical protein
VRAHQFGTQAEVIGEEAIKPARQRAPVLCGLRPGGRGTEHARLLVG